MIALNILMAKELTLDDVFLSIVCWMCKSVDKKDWNTIRFQSRDFETELQEKRKYESIDPPYT